MAQDRRQSRQKHSVKARATIRLCLEDLGLAAFIACTSFRSRHAVAA